MGSTLSDRSDAIYDPGGGRRRSGPPYSPVFDVSNNARGVIALQHHLAAAESGERERMLSFGSGVAAVAENGDDDDSADSEAPFFVTVAQFCTLGGAEEGALVAVSTTAAGVGTMSGGGVSDGDLADGIEDITAVGGGGGGGAVTPASLPALFPKGGSPSGSRFTLSEAVRMVINSSSTEQNYDGTGAAAPPGSASAGTFSMHSVTKRDTIVRVRLVLLQSLVLNVHYIELCLYV